MAQKKNPSTIDLTLDTGAAARGVDRDALIANVEAEIEKLQTYAKSKNDVVEVAERRLPAPKGAQDLSGAIHWLVTFAENPALAPMYARGLIFGVNEIIKAVQTEKQPTNGDKKQEKKGIVTVLKVFGKEIALPAANKVIEEFLKSLSSGGS